MVVNQPHAPGAGLFIAPLNISLIQLNDTHLLGAGPCTPHVVILVTKLNHQDRVVRGITIRATVHNMIGELWLHVGILRHGYTMIQDDLSYRINLMHKPIENGGGCHQTESDATPGAAIKNMQCLQTLHV
jgi:hypothetical protein